jgi:hypothetical protein
MQDPSKPIWINPNPKATPSKKIQNCLEYF